MKRLIAAALASICLIASGSDAVPDITQPVDESGQTHITDHDDAIRLFSKYFDRIEPSDFKDDVNVVYTGCTVHSSLGIDIYATGLLYEKTDDGIVITGPYLPISYDKDVCSEGLKKLYSVDKIGDYAAEYLSQFYSTCSEISLFFPAEVDGVPVVGIADGAFSDCDALKAVYIPHTMKTLDLSVFNKDAKTVVGGFPGTVVDTLPKDGELAVIARVAQPFDVTTDGQIDSGDTMNILRMSVDMEVEPDSKYIRSLADGNGDGEVNSGDALLALRISVGLENEADFYGNHPYTYSVPGYEHD